MTAQAIKAYPSRYAMYSDFPVGAVGAEIGVNFGTNSEHINHSCRPKLFYLVDPWGKYVPHRDGDFVYQEVCSRFKGRDHIKIIRERALEWLEAMPDDHLDWVYLDTLHTYDETKAEIAAILPKLKVGGILSGHDFGVAGPWLSGVFRPVIEAVQDGHIHLTGVTHDAPFISFMAKTLENTP